MDAALCGLPSQHPSMKVVHHRCLVQLLLLVVVVVVAAAAQIPVPVAALGTAGSEQLYLQVYC